MLLYIYINGKIQKWKPVENADNIYECKGRHKYISEDLIDTFWYRTHLEAVQDGVRDTKEDIERLKPEIALYRKRLRILKKLEVYHTNK
jgi:hypothetical protein